MYSFMVVRNKKINNMKRFPNIETFETPMCECEPTHGFRLQTESNIAILIFFNCITKLVFTCNINDDFMRRIYFKL